MVYKESLAMTKAWKRSQ